MSFEVINLRSEFIHVLPHKEVTFARFDRAFGQDFQLPRGKLILQKRTTGQGNARTLQSLTDGMAVTLAHQLGLAMQQTVWVLLMPDLPVDPIGCVSMLVQ